MKEKECCSQETYPCVVGAPAAYISVLCYIERLKPREVYWLVILACARTGQQCNSVGICTSRSIEAGRAQFFCVPRRCQKILRGLARHLGGG